MLKYWAGASGMLEHYDAVSARLDVRARPPEGLMFHAAGSSAEGGFCTYDVWESREHAERWVADHLAPALMLLGGPLSVPPDALEIYELHSTLQPTG